MQDQSSDRQQEGSRLFPEPYDGFLPPTPQATAAKRRMLLAGLGLFAERGYHATTIRDIAAAAGVKSASLYSHFSNKEAILAELVLLGHDEHHRILLQALMGSGVDPREQLAALVRAHVLSHCTYPTLAVVANFEMRHLSEAALAPAGTLRRHSESILAELLGRGEKQGVFHLGSFDATRAAIGALGLSVATFYPDYRAVFTPEALAEANVELAMRMVGATDPDPRAG